MSFTPPSQLKDLVLYWWKILDRPEIPKDYLINYISFDLAMFTLPNTRKILDQAIKRKYLQYKVEKDVISLSKPLKEEFEQWQQAGFEKGVKMGKILQESWREKMEITDEMLFQVMFNDLVDSSVEKQAKLIRNNDITISSTDFSSSISGEVQEEISEGKKVGFPFKIFPKKREIHHKCPLYASNYRDKKLFCSHLARIIMKVYVRNKKEVLELLDDLVQNREQWNFN